MILSVTPLGPIRIQRKRTAGWRMPDGAVNCTRPGLLGNPWTIADLMDEAGVGADEARRIAVDAYRSWLTGDLADCAYPGTPKQREMVLERLHHLRGKTLACWCRPADSCHADVLLELANAAPRDPACVRGEGNERQESGAKEKPAD